MPAETPEAAGLDGFETALPTLRPELHRYCARMTGSVIDGEDVLQEALFKAAQAVRDGVAVENLRAWLFRIAHNAALNFIRSRNNEAAMKDLVRQDLPSSFDQMPTHSETAENLRPFLNLTPKQRSTVILRDVLGYTAAEVAELTDSSVDSVKSALHRGRVLLKQNDRGNDLSPIPLLPSDQEKLELYASCFNAHDFDRLRDMLSAEVRLELVSIERRQGREAVGGYFSNYGKRLDWIMAPGSVEGRAALLAFDREDPTGPPIYFILLEFRDDDVLTIRDFRYARYAMADAQWERF